MLKFENPYRILLVDNDIVTLKVLQNMLQHLGAEGVVIPVHDVIHYIHQPSVIADALLIRLSIKDDTSQLPLMTTLIHELRIPVIAITSNADEQSIVRLKKMGINAILPLPPSAHNLYTTIQTNIDQFNLSKDSDSDDLEEYMNTNYLERIAQNTGNKVQGWKKLLDFTHNDISYANKIIGVALWGIYDDMRLIHQNIISGKRVEALKVLDNLQNRLHVFSEKKIIDNIKQLQDELKHKKANSSEIIEKYNTLQEELLKWSKLVDTNFNEQRFNALLLEQEDIVIEEKEVNTSNQLSHSHSHSEPPLHADFERTHYTPTENKVPIVKSANVLVIDDDNTISKIIEFKLKKEGFNVSICVDGREAIDTIEKGDFDIIITDLMLPYYNGLEIISIVRNQLKKNTPILVLSTIEHEKTVLEALQMGANDYINKPFSAQQLVTRVLKYIN